MPDLPATSEGVKQEDLSPPFSLSAIAALLAHQKTEITGSSDGMNRGCSVWSGRARGQAGWVRWRWTEVQPHVLTVDTAPFSVRSNITLHDRHGVPLSPSQRAIALLTLVHALPWRRQAMDLLYPGQDITSDWVQDH